MRLVPTALAIAAVALPALAAPASVTVDLKGPKGEDMGKATVTEGALSLSRSAPGAPRPRPRTGRD